MPRPSKGARLWLRPARRNSAGAITEYAHWVIIDGRKQISTGVGESAREEAERKLAEHIASKYAPERRERELSQILISDVIAIYVTDVVPRLARPEKAHERADRLLDFFGEKRLSDVNDVLCRAYETERAGKGRSNKGTGGGARRDLQDLAAAIGHHARKGLH